MLVFLFQLQTPARKLKDVCSTGHADSPATIVVGKACLRAAQAVGAAPKVVTNVALFKKDMKMDEDLSGVLNLAISLNCLNVINFFFFYSF